MFSRNPPLPHCWPQSGSNLTLFWSARVTYALILIRRVDVFPADRLRVVPQTSRVGLFCDSAEQHLHTTSQVGSLRSVGELDRLPSRLLKLIALTRMEYKHRHHEDGQDAHQTHSLDFPTFSSMWPVSASFPDSKNDVRYP